MINTIGIIGAGTMGIGITKLFLEKNFRVNLIDNNPQSLIKAREIFKKFIESKLLITNELIEFDINPIIVIEAVPEIQQLKQSIFKEVEQKVSKNTILASNTSGIPITELASSLANKERFLGVHFYMPADVIPIVEVIQSDYTDTAFTELIYNLLASIDKMPVVVKKDIPGFIGNRIQHAMAREAISLLQKGVASAEDIDKVVQFALGNRLVLAGPLKQRDLNGLDTHLNIASYLYSNLENSPAPSELLKEKVSLGKLGVKSGEGFYAWDQEALEIQKMQNEKLKEVIALQKRNSYT